MSSVLTPLLSDTLRKSDLVKDFASDFSGDLNSNSLTEVLAEFSLPLQLDDHSRITDNKATKVTVPLTRLQSLLLLRLYCIRLYCIVLVLCRLRRFRWSYGC